MMGFMDKAKKLAEQAQEKLDEAQQNFNKGGATPGQQAGGTQYDAHGRPVQDAPPAGDPAPPAPEAEPPAADPAAATEPTAPEPPAAPAPSEGSANSTPDPFKPLQQ
jgi:hypothetical protein